MEYWVKSPANVPSGAQNAIKDALLTPQQSYGKDSYTIDLAGGGFCNLSSLKYLTEQQGLSSNRPELVTLWEWLETHPDNKDVLYLTDSESTLQDINKWIGGGAKLSLSKTVDTDILRDIVIKLQQRVKDTTLLIKVKTHRGCPLNEETDILTQWRDRHPARDGTKERRARKDLDQADQQNHLSVVRGLQN